VGQALATGYQAHACILCAGSSGGKLPTSLSYLRCCYLPTHSLCTQAYGGQFCRLGKDMANYVLAPRLPSERSYNTCAAAALRNKDLPHPCKCKGLNLRWGKLKPLESKHVFFQSPNIFPF